MSAGDPVGAVFALQVLGISFVAGAFGSLLGLGGGVILVPALTLVLGVDIRYAIGASIVSVIASSSGAAAVYLRERVTNMRLAMLLEIATTSGALAGAFVAGAVPTRALFLVFGVLMGWSSFIMARHRGEEAAPPEAEHPWAARLRLSASYPDAALGREVPYVVARLPLGVGLMFAAGLFSGLLGIGSGTLKVPAMDRVLRLPLKVSSATSNFMIGVTAAASAWVYFARGDIAPLLAAPVALGVLAGATVGSRLLIRMSPARIRAVFVLVLLLVAVQMVLRGFGISIR